MFAVPTLLWSAAFTVVSAPPVRAPFWNLAARSDPGPLRSTGTTRSSRRMRDPHGMSQDHDRPDPALPDIDQLVVEHSAAVFRLARSVVQDSALADDVTQETFIKVWKHLDTFRGDSSMRSWILRIAHNTAVSTLRTIRDSATDPDKMPHAQDPIPTTRVVEGRLAADDLRLALQQLDDLTREIVVLREVEGMSYDEIAETLDVPVPTVKTRLLRGRRRLGVVLEEWRA